MIQYDVSRPSVPPAQSPRRLPSGLTPQYEAWASANLHQDSDPLCIFHGSDVIRGPVVPPDTMTLGPTPDRRAAEALYGHETMTVMFNPEDIASFRRVPGLGRTAVQDAYDSLTGEYPTIICDLEPDPSSLVNAPNVPLQVSPFERTLRQMTRDGVAGVAVRAPRELPENCAAGPYSGVWDQVQEPILKNKVDLGLEYPTAAAVQANPSLENVRLAIEAKARRGEVRYALNLPMVTTPYEQMSGAAVSMTQLAEMKVHEGRARVYAMVGSTVTQRADR